MIIESIIKRVGGTKVHLDGKDYHFKPGKDAADPHLCDVADEGHQKVLLLIAEGYRDPDAEPIPEVVSLPAGDDDDDNAMTVDVGGKQVDVSKLNKRELESLASQILTDASRLGIEADIEAAKQIPLGNPKKEVLAQRIFDYLTNE